MYGFVRQTAVGPDRGSYYHERFLRGHRSLCKHIPRTQVKGTGIKPSSSPAAEPDLYSYPVCVDDTMPRSTRESSSPTIDSAAGGHVSSTLVHQASSETTPREYKAESILLPDKTVGMLIHGQSEPLHSDSQPFHQTASPDFEKPLAAELEPTPLATNSPVDFLSCNDIGETAKLLQEWDTKIDSILMAIIDHS